MAFMLLAIGLFTVMQTSNTTASLRGIAAVSPTVAWASGAGGTYLRTLDGGTTWRVAQAPGAESLDFRDVEAFDADHAFLMSAGQGKQSRIYKTDDGGVHWSLILENTEEKGFFDAIAFWNPKRGLVMGDPVGGQMYVALTSDGGATWQRVTMPPAREGEGAFAASGTCLITGAKGRAWIATGGIGGSRVYRSTDWGKTWTVADVPIRHDNASSGIFSIAFRDGLHGVAVGGDYGKPSEDRENVAVTVDGGRTWTMPQGARPRGYRSVVRYVPGTRELFAAGTSGIDHSQDDGRSWASAGDGNFNALSFATPKAGWAVGPKGAIARANLE